MGMLRAGALGHPYDVTSEVLRSASDSSPAVSPRHVTRRSWEAGPNAQLESSRSVTNCSWKNERPR
jgi:hypothetical protein